MHMVACRAFEPRSGSRLSRAALLVGASFLVHAAPAQATNECGPPPPGGGTVTCTAAGNPYPNGIDYDPPGGLVADLTVVLQPGVVVDNNGSLINPNGVEIGSSALGVDLSLQGGVATQITTDAANHDAVDVVSVDGTVAVAVDDVDTSQVNSRGIVASGRGTTTVTADTVSTLGVNADGISAEEGNFAAPGPPAAGAGTSVTVNSLSTEGANATGLLAFSENGDTVVDAGTVATGGNFSSAIVAVSAVSDVRVTSDTVTTGGTNSAGIVAQIFPFPDEVPVGTVLVDSGTVDTTGDGGQGILAIAPTTDVTVISDSVTTQGDDARGITARVTGQFLGPGKYTYGEGDILIDSGIVETAGENSDGILAIGADAVTVISDSVSTQGNRSAGIYATSYLAGDISITSGSVVTTGDTDNSGLFPNFGNAHGIEARANEGSITIDSTTVSTGGAAGVTGLSAVGILATSNTGAINIVSGAVTTTGDGGIGISAQTGPGSTPPPPRATAPPADLTIALAPLATPPDISITSTSIATSGDGGVGIRANSTNGDIVIESGAVSTTGLSSRGIFVTTGASIDIDSGSVTTGAYYSDAIRASASGPVSVASVSVETAGDRSIGINANSGNSGITIDSGTAETAGFASTGILARAVNGDVHVASDSATTQGGFSDAINARSDAAGGSVVVNSGSTSTQGVLSRGIYALSLGTVTVTSDTATTTGPASNGITAAKHGGAPGNLSVTSNQVTTSSDSSQGIAAYASTGDVSVTSGSVATAGDYSGGIYAVANGGNITIVSTGAVTTEGRESTGIEAFTPTGAINITSESVETDGDYSIGIAAATGVPPPPPDTLLASALPAAAPVALPPDISITSGTVVTAGASAHGIYATTEQGDIRIDSGAVTTLVSTSSGISAITQSGDIGITSDAVTVHARGTGIHAYGGHSTGGDVIVTSGTVDTGGHFSRAIDVSTRGAVSIESTRIGTGGVYSTGIHAESSNGGITIDSGTIATLNSNARGIYAIAHGEGTITVDSAAITTQGDNGDGIIALGDSDIEITSASIATIGNQSNGIYASALGEGNIVVTSGTVTTLGDILPIDYGASHGIETRALDGSITIGSTSIATAGGDALGILATSNAGAINITSTTVTTGGTGAIGIFAQTGPGATPPRPGLEREAPDIAIALAPVATPPDISITSGTVDTTGANAIGIEAITEDGDIYIESGSVTTRGAAATGILAETKYGSITIDSGTVSTAGLNATGIEATISGVEFDKYAGGTVLVTSDSVTVGGGADAGSLTSGINAAGPQAVTVVSGSVATSGGNVGGIAAGSVYGTVTVTSETLTTEGDFAQGILATSVYGGVDVTSSNSVQTNGADSPGIIAFAFYSGNVAVDSAAMTTLANESPGINAQSLYGDVGVTSDSITTSGDFSDGIFAMASSNVLDDEAEETLDGVVEITSGTIGASGDGSAGIRAYGASVTVTSTSVTTTGQSVVGDFGTVDSGGIYARSFGTRPAIDEPGPILAGLTSVTSGSVSTAGDESHGIHAETDVGDTIVVSTGTVATSGDDSYGILATTGSRPEGDYTGDGTVSVTSNAVTTQGDHSHGIVARGGTVTVASTTVTTSGAGSVGILAETVVAPPEEEGPAAIGILAVGPGGTSVTSGSVTTTGDDSPGIEAHSALGDTEVVSTGTVSTSGANSPGILADSATGFVTVDAAAITTGGAGSDAIVVTSATTSTVTVRGLVQSGQSLALQANGGPVTANIVTTGTLRGRFDLTDGADTFANGGTFDVIGTSQFGGGADVFNNNAGGTVRSVNGAGVVAGGETFNNRALIDMRDGAPDDTLNLAGAFAGQTGSTLGIDVNFDTGTADVLILGTATGSTVINLQATGSVFSLDNDGILVVDASAGTQASAFTLGTALAGNAYISVGLRFDAPAFNFLLVGGPNQPIFETSQIGGMTSALWYKTADAVGAQLDTSRDGNVDGEGGSALRGEGGAGIWVQAMASETDNEAVQSFASGGGTQTFDVEYEQQYEGLQGGVGFGSGGLTFGITGGFGNGDSVFEVTGNRVDIDVKNIGAYAELRSGGLWVNGLIKMDWMDVETVPGPGLAAEFDAKSFGALINLGYRADLGGLFVEPSAGIAWVNTDIDSYQSGGATIDFDDAESMRAHAGIRVGGVFAIGEGSTLAPYVGVRAFEELADGNTNRFTLGQTIGLGDESPGTHGRAEAGFSLHAGNVEAFLRGELDFGGETEGKGVRGGLRLRF